MGTSFSPLLILLVVLHPILLSYSNISIQHFTYSKNIINTDGDDQNAMGAISEAITGIPPKSWDDFLDYCSWDGITCDYYPLRVTSINLSSRNLTGVLPSKALNSLTYLHSLFLQNNSFYGALPCLANLPFLKVVDLSYNSFNAVIPNSFSNLTSLRKLSISNNPNLSHWVFPSELVDSKSLVTLSADYAHINGPIPDFFASFRSLQHLNLSHNDLTGTVPGALTSLPSLTKIDISYNRLSGTIPVFHAGVSARYAGNNFEFKEKEAGVKFKLVEVLYVIILPITGLIALWIILYFVTLKWCKKHKEEIFEYQDLETATNRFDIEKKVGNGCSGDVYQGFLGNGVKVAVKLIKDSELGLNMFVNEALILRLASHHNVVKMIGLCLERHKLIVYEYMEKGSLDKWIWNSALPWHQRKKIIKQVAKGLHHLHNHNIVHLDIKPQNVLLDDQLNAKVSDLGLAMILNTDGTTEISKCCGTPGYMAPELWQQIVSKKSDVYSYGVLVLETVFKKKFKELLDKSVISKVQNGQITDLIIEENMSQHKLLEIEKTSKLALWCLNYMQLADRPSMSEVVKVLEGSAMIPEEKIDYSMVKILEGSALIPEEKIDYSTEYY